MDDPWDVKSVRQAGQYTSCMKLNGAPLLPPVLSKECRTEMQYYKLLAKEVEKRISILQPFLADSETESSEDKMDALVISQSPQLPKENMESAFDLNIDKISALTQQNKINSSPSIVSTSDGASSKLVIDFSLCINQTGRNLKETVKTKSPCPCIELPERDYNCVKSKELLLDVENSGRKKPQITDKALQDIANFSTDLNKDELLDPFPESISSLDGHPSLSSKSFTGSLNDLHTESLKEASFTTLVRQRSYTLLKPSPQLLAHLEIQSYNTGIEMNCISMSDSLSNLSTPNKKRRSWDLESAKVKWSSMALELKNKQLLNSNNPAGNRYAKSAAKKTVQAIYSPSRAKSVLTEKNRRGSTPSKPSLKSEPIQKRGSSPIRNIPSNITIVKGPVSSQLASQLKEPSSPKSPTPQSHVVSDSEDPATKVRELYDKIQKQQLMQMASLVEKQKREQMLLQQVFEEQNSLLFKQLKTIVPKSCVEAKEAWGDKSSEDKGPVSLSQLINHKSPEQINSPVSSTLTDTKNYINKCDNVLKKSRDISNSIKKPKPAFQYATKIHSPRIPPEGSRTRTNSPARNKSTSSPLQSTTSRRLNYNSSPSDRPEDPILTDRTNDTMADLNVTFPTDVSEFETCCDKCDNNTFHHCGNEVTVIHPNAIDSLHSSSVDSAINCMERTIQESINNSGSRRPKSNTSYNNATPRERAAATKIVAFAKGFLVRRLMRTERVRATVQTIRDALLCALQLHQDREGIWGADVDLHRRLIQQITAACYSLHDTFISSTAAARCAMLAADRKRRRDLTHRLPTPLKDIMSQSHSGVFPARPKRVSASLMTQSTYETYSNDKGRRSRYMPSPRRRPWR